MVVVMSSGSDYTPEYMKPFDFAEPYLRAIFGFVGITDITFVRAGGMDMGPDVRKAGQRAAITEGRALVASGAWRPEPALPAASVAASTSTAPALVA